MVAKILTLDEDHDALEPVAQRLHRIAKLHSRRDVHYMIPVADLTAGGRVPYSAYFWLPAVYNSPQPCNTGITILRLAPNSDDGSTTFKDKEESRLILRFSLFQWKGTTGQDRNMYSVKIVTDKDHNYLWKNLGITDITHFRHILQLLTKFRVM